MGAAEIDWYRVDPAPARKVLTLMEATSVTGVAKGYLDFGRWLATPEGQRVGLRLAVATFERGSEAGKANGFIDAARAAGIDTYLIRERHRYDPGVLGQLRELIARLDPAILETHTNKSHLIARLLSAERRRRRWLAFHHGDTYTDLKQRAYNQLDRVSLRSADRVITVCQAFMPLLVSRGVRPERIRVLHSATVGAPPVCEAEQLKLREALGIEATEAVILSVGRLSREKGQEYLIQALARLPRTAGKCKLVLLGAGPDLRRLERLTSALGLTQRVVFAGFHAKVAPFYAIADVFALPSLSEGSSSVLLEAMTAEVPIVATRVGGNPEIALDGETALLVPAADPDRLAAGLATLLADRALASRLAKAGYARALGEFSLDRYTHRRSSVYAELLPARA